MTTNHPTNPADIARETLRRLAAGNLAPTPANYQAFYHEIANVQVKAPFPTKQLEKLATALSNRNMGDEESLEALRSAIAKNSWKGVESTLIALIDGLASDKKLADPAISADFAAALARFIESTLPALGEHARQGSVAENLLHRLRKPPVDLQTLQHALSSAAHQTLISAEEQEHIKASLLRLMRLLLENIDQLTLDEHWLKGQIQGLKTIVEPPISLRNLDHMEQRLNEVILKQGEVRQQAIQAREDMKIMLSAFVENLATMNESSTSFQKNIENSARKIKAVSRIEDLGPLLKDVIDATHVMKEETSQAQNQLKSMQEKVETTEATLERLYEELDRASALARHDPLTDALNRKGLDDALSREISALRRKNQPLSICMLDIDNFKKLNDRLGHEAGDRALIHLASVARESIRPNDTLARFGGEEFVILMPDTTLEHGIEAMTRLQRELTKAFFLSGNEKVLITFSAGVAQVRAEESGIEAVNRADQAMYLAKRAGKNRVMGS